MFEVEFAGAVYFVNGVDAFDAVREIVYFQLGQPVEYMNDADVWERV